MKYLIKLVKLNMYYQGGVSGFSYTQDRDQAHAFEMQSIAEMYAVMHLDLSLDEYQVVIA